MASHITELDFLRLYLLSSQNPVLDGRLDKQPRGRTDRVQFVVRLRYDRVA